MGHISSIPQNWVVCIIKKSITSICSWGAPNSNENYYGCTWIVAMEEEMGDGLMYGDCYYSLSQHWKFLSRVVHIFKVMYILKYLNLLCQWKLHATC